MSTSTEDRFDNLFRGKERPSPLPLLPLHFSQVELDSVHICSSTTPMQQDDTTGNKQSTAKEDDDDDASASALTHREKFHMAKKPEAGGLGSRDTSIEDAGRIKYLPSGKRYLSNSRAQDEDQVDEEEETDIEPSSHGTLVVGRFCVLASLAKFPYKYMEDPDERVSRRFFAGGRFYQRLWDLYYVLAREGLGYSPIYLVPLLQVQQLIRKISETFNIEVDVPATMTFYGDGTPQPTFLGTSISQDSMKELQKAVAVPLPHHGDSPPGCHPDTQRAFAAFHEKCQRALIASKKNNNATGKKRNQKRIQTAIEFANQLKRAERYFGLRPRPNVLATDQSPVGAQVSNPGFLAEKVVLPPQFSFDEPVSYPFESEPVFIGVDVETWERNHNFITEIGVSTLDTLDLQGIPPGPEAENWTRLIRSRHFRVKEHKHLVNSRFCQGNPDSFQYGKSEWVTIDEAAAAVDSCFKWPYSLQYRRALLLKDRQPSLTDRESREDSKFDAVEHVSQPNNEDTEVEILSPLRRKTSLHNNDLSEPNRSNHRNLIIVGHDLSSDLSCLARLGSGIFGDGRVEGVKSRTQPLPERNRILSSVLETLDTATLYKTLRKESNPRSLASVCHNLGISAWFPHNGGNDARYTLEALIKLVITARKEEDETRQISRKSSGPGHTRTNMDAVIPKSVDEKVKLVRQESDGELAANFENEVSTRNE